MRIFFISPTSSQPRFHKRAKLLNSYIPVSIFAFQRGLYEENTFQEDLDFTKLGKIKDGNYFDRLKNILTAIKKIRKHKRIYRNEELIFYALSLDSLLIAKLSGIKRGFYEIGDIRFLRNKINLFSIIEALLIKSIDGVVVTSPSFTELVKPKKFYKSKTPFYLIENKVINSLKRPKIINEELSNKSKIKIGLIGFLRYKLPILRVVSFLDANKDLYELHCWGDGAIKSLIRDSRNENIFYYGSFKNPDDLEKIYSSVDLNFTVYGGDPSSEIGVKHALPNKYYESAFFHVPIICRLNTKVAEKSLQKGIGFEVDIHSQESFNLDMLAITKDKITAAKRNCFDVSDDEIYDDSKIIIESMLKENDFI